MNNVETVFKDIKKLEGKVETYTGKDPVGAVAIKKYAIAVDDRNPLYLDEEYAANSTYGGIVAPYTFIFENVHDFYAPVGKDGIVRGHVELFPPPFDSIIRGGNEYEFFQRVRPSDIISFTRTVKSISLRKGKKAPLIVWVNEYSYKNQREETLAINRETFLYTAKGNA